MSKKKLTKCLWACLFSCISLSWCWDILILYRICIVTGQYLWTVSAKVSKFRLSANNVLNLCSIIWSALPFVIVFPSSETTPTTVFVTHSRTILQAVGELPEEIQKSSMWVTCSGFEKKLIHLHPHDISPGSKTKATKSLKMRSCSFRIFRAPHNSNSLFSVLVFFFCSQVFSHFLCAFWIKSALLCTGDEGKTPGSLLSAPQS